MNPSSEESADHAKGTPSLTSDRGKLKRFKEWPVATS